MDDLDEIKINNAVHECLDRCYRTHDILPTIATFLKRLRASEGWSNSEIVAVELAVHNVLHGVISGDEPVGHGVLYDGDSANNG